MTRFVESGDTMSGRNESGARITVDSITSLRKEINETQISVFIDEKMAEKPNLSGRCLQIFSNSGTQLCCVFLCSLDALD